jgi:hypothetical protein
MTANTGAANEVPNLGQALPFVDEYGSLPFEQAGRVGPGDRELGGVVKGVHRVGPLERGASLADPLRSLDGDRGKITDQLVELVVHNMALIRSRSHHGRATYRARQTEAGVCGSS